MLSVCASHDRHVYPPLQGSDAIKKVRFVKGHVPVLVLVRVMQTSSVIGQPVYKSNQQSILFSPFVLVEAGKARRTAGVAAVIAGAAGVTLGSW